jgi:hypothetical protein
MVAAAPAMAASLTLTDSKDTRLTVTDLGTIDIACGGDHVLSDMDEGYTICVDNQARAFVLGSSFNQNVTGVSVSSATTPGEVPIGDRVVVEALSSTTDDKLGIHTFVTWVSGTCEFCISVKLFNKSTGVIKLTQYKRIAHADLPEGDGDDDIFFGGFNSMGGPDSLKVIAADPDPGEPTVIMQGGGNTGATKAQAYHQDEDREEDELESCIPVAPDPDALLLPPGATRKKVQGDRILVAWYDFAGIVKDPMNPSKTIGQGGGVPLKPKGQKGSEKFFEVCYTVHGGGATPPP